jgi:hypothetical protein
MAFYLCLGGSRMRPFICVWAAVEADLLSMLGRLSKVTLYLCVGQLSKVARYLCFAALEGDLLFVFGRLSRVSSNLKVVLRLSKGDLLFVFGRLAEATFYLCLGRS